MKIFFATIAAAMVLVGIAAQPAEARCFWSGYGWTCYHHYGDRFVGRYGDRYDRDRFDRDRFDRDRYDRDRFSRFGRERYYGGGYGGGYERHLTNWRWGY